MLRGLLFLFITCSVVSSARAGLMLTVEGVPTQYTAGDSFSFDVRLQGAENLNEFFIELVLSAESGVADVDFFFDELQTVQHPTEYVFSDPSLNPGGFAAFVITDNNQSILGLSDLLDSGEEVSTSENVNEFIATVVVQTAADIGDLSIEFDTTFMELTNDAGGPIGGFDNLVTTLDNSSPIVIASSTTNVIPEPTSMAIFGGIVALGAVSSRRRRRSTKA